MNNVGKREEKHGKSKRGDVDAHKVIILYLLLLFRFHRTLL